MTMIGKLRSLLSRREKKIILLLLIASMFISFLETFSLSLVLLFATVSTNLEVVFQNKYFSTFYNFFGFNSPSQFVILFGVSLIAFYFLEGLFCRF